MNRKARRVEPRDAPPYFALSKISGLLRKATLRWMRSMPGSFWDFPAPRFWLLNGQDARSPSTPRFWPPRITRSASARWWAQDAAHPCQRSLCFTLLWAKRCELYEILPPIASRTTTKPKLKILFGRILCAQIAPPIFGIGRRKRSRLRRNKGNGIRDE